MPARKYLRASNELEAADVLRQPAGFFLATAVRLAGRRRGGFLSFRGTIAANYRATANRQNLHGPQQPASSHTRQPARRFLSWQSGADRHPGDGGSRGKEFQRLVQYGVYSRPYLKCPGCH